MKSFSVCLLIDVCLTVYTGLACLVQETWASGCSHATACETQVYTPGEADEIAVTLPAGTPCRVGDTVGDTWQQIEYMLGGKALTGMVRSTALIPLPPQP